MATDPRQVYQEEWAKVKALLDANGLDSEPGESKWWTVKWGENGEVVSATPTDPPNTPGYPLSRLNAGLVLEARPDEECEINDPDKWFGLLMIEGLSTGDNRG